MFDPAGKLLLGLVTGIVFGVLLQKGRVAKYRVILGQLLLRDWTVVKIMGTAIVVGAVGVFALVQGNLATFHIKPFHYVGIVLGAVCFGAGMAIFGYCPGTSVAACGEGRRDAMVGVVGMLAGAGAYVLAYPWLDPIVKGAGGLGKVTLPELWGVSPWYIVAGLGLVGVSLIAIDVYKRKDNQTPHGSSPIRGRTSLPTPRPKEMQK